jgi:ribosomal protein S18 acetylase RimI-like enzyme
MLSTVSVNPVGYIKQRWLGGAQPGIRPVETASDYSQARKLLRAYAGFMNVDLEIDGFSAELQSLSTVYRLPHGTFYVATKGKNYVGCAGWRRFEPGIAEVKRMFVVPQYSGQGIGRMLLEQVIAAARAHNMTRLRLEVLTSSTAAIALYRRLGFKEIAHYRPAALAGLDYLSMQLEIFDA